MIGDTEIPQLILDPENEEFMLQQYYARVASASNNRITDFSSGSVPATFGEGTVFAIAEMQYYLNMMPTALALEVLRLSGQQRLPGTYATGELTFLLSGRLSGAFSIPAGYVVPYNPTNTLEGSGYELLQPLYIPPNALEARVRVRATHVGSVFNQAELALQLSGTGFANLRAIYNSTRLSGGSELEPLERTIVRAQRALRERDVLVSGSDYEQKVVDITGGGVAKAIPQLDADRQTKKVGHVHVFYVTDEVSTPSVATCQTLTNAVQELSFSGCMAHVSGCQIADIQVELGLTVPQLSETLADNIYNAVLGYLHPSSLGIGATISRHKLIAIVQNVIGLSGEVLTCLIENEPLNRPMATAYTVPKLDSLVISMTDQTGLSQQYLRGPFAVDTF